jgi:hypothetical protein
MSSRKLRHYFEAHTIKVLTNQPLNDIFGNRDSFGRISKWAMELSEYVIDFEKCNAIKSQDLLDFVAEWTEAHSVAGGEVPETPWVVYCDGGWGGGQLEPEQQPYSFHLQELSCATQRGCNSIVNLTSALTT